MFKQMLKPGLTAGIIGTVVSVLFSVLLILTFLIGPVALVLSMASPVISLLLDLGIGLLAALFAQRRTLEKLSTNQGAVAGVIAGAVSLVVGLALTPAIQALNKAMVSQQRITELTMEWYRSMGMSQQQLDMLQTQMNTQPSGNQMAVGIGAAVVCGIVWVAVCAGGGALGALIFKPTLRRKLVCTNCQAAFELGGNAFVEVKEEGRPDLVDYCSWDDLAPEAAKQQRAVIVDVVKTKGQGRQWQCGMCKTVQAY
jgi:hypothetical protein